MNAPQPWTPAEEALRLIMSRIQPVTDACFVPMRSALGRVLAEDIRAPFDVPGSDNSAMDGYACRIADLSPDESAELRVTARAMAGAADPATAVAPGECARIMTGAVIPAGADIVIPQEEAETLDDGRVRIVAAARKAGAHIRRAGEDLRGGAAALPAGTLCRPAHIGLMGSLGMTEAPALRRLRVAFFSTGDEVKKAGETLQPGEVYDSNRHSIWAMLSRMGFEALDMGVAPDSPEALDSFMDSAMRGADAVIASGGASVGEADFIRPALQKRGEVLFWRVAMRPGRPLAYGKIGNADFFGLPGNPVSVMVCFYQFVAPALWKRAGRIEADCAPPAPLPAITTVAIKKSPGRVEYQRGIARLREDGALEVAPAGEQGSGILSSMTRANCFIVLEHDRGPVASGEAVSIQWFEGLA